MAHFAQDPHSLKWIVTLSVPSSITTMPESAIPSSPSERFTYREYFQVLRLGCM